MKELYKIRHIPTGLFICNSRETNHHSNLSKTGKVYESPVAWIQIQSGNLGSCVNVTCANKLYKELSEKFPDKVKDTFTYHYNEKTEVRFYTNPSDFEKVIVNATNQSEDEVKKFCDWVFSRWNDDIPIYEILDMYNKERK